MSSPLDRSLFEAAAQLIPVFFLVVLVESRFRLPVVAADPEKARPLATFVGRMILMLTVVLGEVAALTAIAGRPTVLEGYVVVEVLGILGVYVIAPTVVREIADVRDRVQHPLLKNGLIAISTFVLTAPMLPGLVMAFR